MRRPGLLSKVDSLSQQATEYVYIQSLAKCFILHQILKKLFKGQFNTKKYQSTL